MTDCEIVLRNLICQKVDSTAEEVFQTISNLVQIPSVVGHEGKAQEWIAALYNSLGLNVTRVVPIREQLGQYPDYVETGFPYTEDRPNIVGILPGIGKGRSLILNGHVDVVSPEPVETWERGGPWSGIIEGNRLYGRGAADMKSGLIANYFALKTLLDLGLRPKGEVLLESVIEEEAGGSGGTLAMLMNGYRADGMIIPEPFNLQIITAHPGINFFRIKVYGKTAHAAQSHKGINAIGKLIRVYERLIQLDEDRAQRNHNNFFEKWTGRSCNLNIGKFKAGDWPSIVAGWGELEGRISYLPGEKEDDIQKEIKEVLEEVVRKDEWLREHPPEIEWLSWRTKPWVQDHNIPLIQIFQQTASEILSECPEVSASTTGLDTRFSQFFGVPSFAFGPIGGLLHCSNEYVELNSVIKTIKVLAGFIVNWCGVE